MSLPSRLLLSLPALMLLMLLLPGAALRAQPFTDLVDFPRDEANRDRFYDLEAHLAGRFAGLCADTLCEGEYSNLRALQLRCSVDAARAQVQACTWLFVASELTVAADTGQVQADNRRWACALPLGAGVPVETFHAALDGEAPLSVTLPGAQRSVGAAVGACLQAPRPVATAHAAAGPYVDARDYPRPGLGQAPLQAMEQALVRGFDNICGDTFCEGEYANLQAMRLRCSVHAPSGVAGQCAWTFAGSRLAVDTATGAVTVDARDWACPLPLAPGTAWPQLLSTLQGAEAIDTVLPGTGSTVYDGLTDCL